MSAIELSSYTTAQLTAMAKELAEQLGTTAPDTYHTKQDAIARVQYLQDQLAGPECSDLSEATEEEVEAKVRNLEYATYKGKSWEERAAHRGFHDVAVFKEYRAARRAHKTAKREGNHEAAEAARLLANELRRKGTKKDAA